MNKLLELGGYRIQVVDNYEKNVYYLTQYLSKFNFGYGDIINFFKWLKNEYLDENKENLVSINILQERQSEQANGK